MDELSLRMVPPPAVAVAISGGAMLDLSHSCTARPEGSDPCFCSTTVMAVNTRNMTSSGRPQCDVMHYSAI